MFAHTDIKQAPWYVVKSDNKKHARLNCIAHLLSLIPYEDLTPEPIKLPKREEGIGYVRPPITDQTFVSGCLSLKINHSSLNPQKQDIWFANRLAGRVICTNKTAI